MRRGPRLLGPRRPPGSREEGARSALIAFVSTLILAGLALWFVLTSEAWPRVQKQFFNPSAFREVWPDVVSGFWLDIQMFLVAEVVILTLALIVAMIRSLRGPAFLPIRVLAIFYIDLVRGIPVILLILCISSRSWIGTTEYL